jgi:hypothetical protein
MSDAGGSVTLIFYSIGHDFWKEPFLNLVAAGATMSTFTHVEIAIGIRTLSRRVIRPRVPPNVKVCVMQVTRRETWVK